MNHTVNLLMSQFVTHDVKCFIVSKPEGFSIVSGQGVESAINLPGLSEQGRPFTRPGLAADRAKGMARAPPNRHGLKLRRDIPIHQASVSGAHSLSMCHAG